MAIGVRLAKICDMNSRSSQARARREFLRLDEMDPDGAHLCAQAGPARLLVRHETRGCRMNLAQHLVGCELTFVQRRHPAPDPLMKRGDADHVELVEVCCADGKEPQTL